MRLVTKAILLLSLVALGVFVFYIAGREGGFRGGRVARPTVQERSVPQIDDPLAPYERLRERVAREYRRAFQQSAGSETDAGEVRQTAHDLESSAQDEVTVMALRTETPILGADPPGPTLRPEGAEGVVVTQRWLKEEPEAGQFHVIQSGDTLYGIAIKHYGDPGLVRVIQAANPGLDPMALKVGERVVLPDVSKPQEKPAETPVAKVYEVQKGDTLIGIARRFYGKASMYRKIYEANRDLLSSPNATLHVGMRLRLPEPE